MRAPGESLYAKLSGIAAVLGVIVGLLGVFVALLAWRCPDPLLPCPADLRHEEVKKDRAEVGKVAGESTAASEETASTPMPAPESPSQITEAKAPRLPRSADMPMEFSLRDGDQKVLLSGRASIGIQFNQLGEERFVTLRVNADGGSQSHAILGAAARYPFHVGATEYHVSLLSADFAELSARLRVDRTN